MQAHGIHGTGSAAYSPLEYRVVVQHLITFAYESPVTVAMLSEMYGVSGNAVRAIVRDADGVEFVTGNSSHGYRLAINHEELQAGTTALVHQIEAMATRIARRTEYAARHL